MVRHADKLLLSIPVSPEATDAIELSFTNFVSPYAAVGESAPLPNPTPLSYLHQAAASPAFTLTEERRSEEQSLPSTPVEEISGDEQSNQPPIIEKPENNPPIQHEDEVDAEIPPTQ